MPSNPSRNIVVCSDGTGNTANKGRGTNVFKLYEAVDFNRYHSKNGTEQIAIYDDGVGTSHFKPIKLIGGMFGYGLTRNVHKLYFEIARLYRPDDKLYFFGFSRGAFTVRVLASLICHCGIPEQSGLSDSQLSRKISKNYRDYRKNYRTGISRGFRYGLSKSKDLGKLLYNKVAGQSEKSTKKVDKKKSPLPADHKVHFVGVWDTVDAVGFPIPFVANFINWFIYCYKFPNNNVPEGVGHAAHALSIDDQRLTFHPELWNALPSINTKSKSLEQVWFSGVHSNVGGGYPRQGLSLVALDWMTKKAKDKGLDIIKSDEDYAVEHKNPYAKIYDSRSGPAMYFRYQPRDIFEKCKKANVPARIHASVLQRIVAGSEGYAPGNLPGDMEIEVTHPNKHKTQIQKIIKVYNGALPERANSLLDLTHETVRLRRHMHYIFMTLSVMAGYLTYEGWKNGGTGVDILQLFITLDGWQVLMDNFLYRPWLLSVLAVFLFGGLYYKSVLENFYSAWWQKVLAEIQSKGKLAEYKLD